MLSISAFSLPLISLAVATALAWATVRLLASRLPNGTARQAGSLMLDTLLIGLLGARLVFVLSWWSEYAQAPRTILAINDGGYHVPSGLLAAMLWIAWRTRSQPQLRRVLYGGVLVGLLSWGLLNALPSLLRGGVPSLPAAELSALGHSEPVALTGFTGQPVVINLWATWCPPCRREMPVLQEAQRRYPNVTFLLINQGESTQQVEAFLRAEALVLDHVLLDPFSSMMREMGSRGLPTTLYFDAHGHLVEFHIGELTMPGLSTTLKRHFGDARSEKVPAGEGSVSQNRAPMPSGRAVD